MANNLLDKSSIILTPTAYNNGEALCVKPSDGSGDFDFSRNSAATRVNAQGLVENVQILSSNLVQNGDFSEEGSEEVSNGSFSQEGSELVTNGSFDTDSNWTTNDWNISGGSLNGSASTGIVFQNNLGVVVGKTYKVVLEISNYTSGSIRFKVGGASYQNIASEDGVQEFYFVAATSANNILFSVQSAYTGSIDNVSVREVGQDWDLGTGWSIGEDKVIYDGSGYSGIGQIIPNLIGKIFKVQFDIIDYTSGTIRISPSNKESGSDIRYSNNGTYVEYYTSAQNRLDLQPQLFDGSITNISVKEVLQDWTAISSSALSIDNGALKISNVTQGYGKAGQSFSTISGKTYKIKFDGFVGTAAQFQYRLGTTEANTNIAIQAYSTNQTIEAQFIALSSLTYLTFVTQTAATGVYTNIDNVSVIEITDDTNLPRINYEGFSYQDVLGSEEVVNGDFSDGSANWSAIRGSIQSVSDEGVFTIGGTELNSLVQSNVFTVGKKYILEFYAKSQTYNTNIFTAYFGVDSVIQEQVVSSEFQKWKYVINPNQTNLQIGLYYNASYENIIFDNVSVKEYLGQEVVPDSGCGSWLWEPQSTNLIEYSNDYADAYWTVKANSSISSNAIISPDGNLNADKLVENTSSSTHYINKNSFVLISGVDYTYSVFAKAGERSNFWLRTINGVGDAYFDLSNGTITSGVGGFIEDYGNGWYRCSVSGTSTSTTGNPYIYLVKSGTTTNYLGDGTSGLYIYGFQVEQQSYATSYIPTEGATVTRNQDVCTNGGSLASINSTEGVLYAEIAALADDLTDRTIALSDGTISNTVRIQYLAVSNAIWATVTNIGAGGNQGVVRYTSTDITINSKVALKFAENDFALWVDGVEVDTDTSGVTFPANTLNTLQFDRGNGTQNFFGKTKALAVFPYLTDSELQSLTTI